MVASELPESSSTVDSGDSSTVELASFRPLSWSEEDDDEELPSEISVPLLLSALLDESSAGSSELLELSDEASSVVSASVPASVTSAVLPVSVVDWSSLSAG